MTKISNIFGTKFSGRIGKDMVAASWKGHEYVRTYAKPPNRNTEGQQEARGRFAEAVGAWQELSHIQRLFYGRIAEGMSGFNLYISRHVTAVQEEEEPEQPMEACYVTADGEPVKIGSLKVKSGGHELFTLSLKDGRAVVALTESDSPYTFILKRGREEEEVLKVMDLSETGMPQKLESKTLRIKLVKEK